MRKYLRSDLLYDVIQEWYAWSDMKLCWRKSHYRQHHTCMQRSDMFALIVNANYLFIEGTIWIKTRRSIMVNQQCDSHTEGKHCCSTRRSGDQVRKYLKLLNFLCLDEMHSFRCMGKIFCVEFQRYPLKFHTKYLAHTLKDVYVIKRSNFKISYI